MKTIHEPAREIPVLAEVDVLVAGGGPSGLMAAQAAAADGKARVMLVESRGYLGGNLTIGLPILAFLGPKGNQVVKGAAQKFIDRLRALGEAAGTAARLALAAGVPPGAVDVAHLQRALLENGACLG